MRHAVRADEPTVVAPPRAGVISACSTVEGPVSLRVSSPAPGMRVTDEASGSVRVSPQPARAPVASGASSLAEDAARWQSVLSQDPNGPVPCADDTVRTRLYFTSESHLNTLLNVIRFWAEAGGHDLDPRVHNFLANTPELDYLAHIIFRVYENTGLSEEHPLRHRVEILFSPGAAFCPFDGQPREPFSPAHEHAHPTPAQAYPPPDAGGGPAATLEGAPASVPSSQATVDAVTLVLSMGLGAFEAMCCAATQATGGVLNAAGRIPKVES